MMEMPFPGSDHYDRALKGYETANQRTLDLYRAYAEGRDALCESLETRFIGSFDARPHWGLMNFLTEATARSIYPEWDKWKAHYLRANQHGIFNCPMTDQLGISV